MIINHTGNENKSMVFPLVPGEYKVQLPDGRVQIVSYEADDYGFRPTVHYEYPHGEPNQESSALFGRLFSDFFCPDV